MTEDQLQYPVLIDHAMRGVVREVLKRVQATGLPGEHHFYISFLTNFPGVRMSEQLKSRYPKEITIVMQHQYWDFKVEEQSFTVTLSFGGVPEKLVIPYAALTAFADPSIKFGLQFQHSETDEDLTDITIELQQDIAAPRTDDATTDENTAEIISLDSFRKK
jgi:hypothetical protein